MDGEMQPGKFAGAPCGGGGGRIDDTGGAKVDDDFGQDAENLALAALARMGTADGSTVHGSHATPDDEHRAGWHGEKSVDHRVPSLCS